MNRIALSPAGGTAGFTLVELMIIVSVLALVTTTIGSLTVQVFQDRAAATGYLTDVAASRRVLRAVDADLRAGRRVVPIEQGFRIHRSAEDAGVDDAVDYRVAEGVVTRTRSGRTEVLARCVASLEARQEGRMVSLLLRIQSRRRGRRQPHAGVVRSAVCLVGTAP